MSQFQPLSSLLSPLFPSRSASHHLKVIYYKPLDSYSIHPTTPSSNHQTSQTGTFVVTETLHKDDEGRSVELGIIHNVVSGREEDGVWVRVVDGGEVDVYDYKFVERWWGEGGHGYKNDVGGEGSKAEIPNVERVEFDNVIKDPRIMRELGEDVPTLSNALFNPPL